MNLNSTKGMWLLYGFAIILNSVTTVVLLLNLSGDSTIQKQESIMPQSIQKRSEM